MDSSPYNYTDTEVGIRGIFPNSAGSPQRGSDISIERPRSFESERDDKAILTDRPGVLITFILQVLPTPTTRFPWRRWMML